MQACIDDVNGGRMTTTVVDMVDESQESSVSEISSGSIHSKGPLRYVSLIGVSVP